MMGTVILTKTSHGEGFNMNYFSKISALLLLVSSLMANPISQYRGEKAQAMGQTGVASQKGHQAILINPALLADYDSWNVNLYATFGVNGVLWDYGKWAIDNADNLSDFDTLMTKLDPIDNKWAPFLVQGGIGAQIKEFAFNFSWNNYTKVAMTKAPITPVLGVGAHSNFKMAFGHGREILNGYNFGITLFGKYEIEYADKYIGTASKDFWTVYNTMNDSAKSEWSKITVAEEVAETKLSFGGNVGVTKAINDQFTAGISLIDIPTDFSPNIGVNWHKLFGDSAGVTALIDANVDWQNMFVTDYYFQQFKFGSSATMKYNNTKFAYVALGLNDGYPTGGFQIGYYAYLSYVYYVEEEGTFPGQKPLSFHKISFEINI